MKTFCLFFFLLLTAGHVFSQKDSSIVRPSNQIKISPLRFIDPINPGYEISYERLHGKRYSTQLSLAYMTNTVWNIPFKNIRGYRIGLEEKYFFKSKYKDRSYLSADGVAYHVLFNEELSGTRQSPADSTTFIVSQEKTSYRKNTYTFNIKYGLQAFISKQVLIDVCIGLGVRYYQVNQLSFPDSSFYVSESKSPLPNLYDLASDPWHYFTINIPFNIKFGYTF